MNLKYALRNEDTEQIAVIQWSQWMTSKYPELKWLYHCPNGGGRNRNEAAKLKQMGVRSGVCDLQLPCPKGIYCGLYIEMKHEGGRLLNTQKEFLKDMAELGHFVATCYSAVETIEVIKQYVSLENWFIETRKEIKESLEVLQYKNKLFMSIPNNSILKGGNIK